MADELLALLRQKDPSLELKHNKFYIGLARNGEPDNFVVFKPQKSGLRLEPRVRRSDEIKEKLENAGLDVAEYDVRRGRYHLRLAKGDVERHREVLQWLLDLAYRESSEGES